MKEIRAAKPGSRLSDGGGLRLETDAKGNASWVLRYTSPTTQRERYMGLGPLRDVGIALARRKAQDARNLILEGKDPLQERDASKAARRAEAARSITFAQYAASFIAERETTWRSAAHQLQWHNSLLRLAMPEIGHMPIADIDTGAVLRVLRPIWNRTPETANRVRNRIEIILNAAKAEGLRTVENSAAWRGHLDQLFVKRSKLRPVVHHAALPYADAPKFWRLLSADKSDSARMLSFIILTACRYGEAAGADWSEIVGDVWTVPASRMKAGLEHRVPLTSEALEVLGEPDTGPIFPSPMTGKPISDRALAKTIARHTGKPATIHGFRSTFRDWAGDETETPREIVEHALAHAVGSESERSYRRGTALERRRELMGAWARYLLGQ
jgi:integrase